MIYRRLIDFSIEISFRVLRGVLLITRDIPSMGSDIWQSFHIFMGMLRFIKNGYKKMMKQLDKTHIVEDWKIV